MRNSRRITCLVFCWLVILIPAGAAFGGVSDVADAAMRKDISAVRTLVQQKVDINAVQRDGATALHWAARWDDVPMAELLIRAGANVSATNRFGVTPLSLAA